MTCAEERAFGSGPRTLPVSALELLRSTLSASASMCGVRMCARPYAPSSGRRSSTMMWRTESIGVLWDGGGDGDRPATTTTTTTTGGRSCGCMHGCMQTVSSDLYTRTPRTFTRAHTPRTVYPDSSQGHQLERPYPIQSPGPSRVRGLRRHQHAGAPQRAHATNSLVHLPPPRRARTLPGNI